MKNNQYLSQFQKEQYTTYLEGQLEKFSAFMLAQRKENEKYKSIEDILSQHQKSIGQMKDQIELLEVYQHQNLQNCEHINKKMAKVEEL
jgi:hypothetical protein